MTDILTDELYTQILLDAVHQPQHRGDMLEPDLTTTTGNASCGDEVIVKIKLSTDKTLFKAVKWQGQGCIISQAHMDGMAAAVIGQKLLTVKTWGRPEVLALFGLTNISSSREKCLMLGLKAIQQAISSSNTP